MQSKDHTEAVAAQVRAEVARANIPYVALAEPLGLSPQALSRRMNGQIPFDVNELIALAILLGVPVSRLLPEAAVA